MTTRCSWGAAALWLAACGTTGEGAVSGEDAGDAPPDRRLAADSAGAGAGSPSDATPPAADRGGSPTPDPDTPTFRRITVDAAAAGPAYLEIADLDGDGQP